MEVSVIIPCFNAASTLKRAVESVLIQNYIKEIIIIDDCSSDLSLQVAQDLILVSTKISIVCNSFNMGPAACRNLGLDRASGKYIAFLDSDDFWLPGKMDLQITMMDEKKIEFSYHDYYEFVYEDYNLSHVNQVKSPEKASLPYFYYKRRYGMCLTSILLRKSIGNCRFPVDKSIFTEDYYFFLKLLKSGIIGYRIPKSFGVYTIQSKSRSKNKMRQAISVLQTNFLLSDKNVLKSIWFFSLYVSYQFFFRRLNIKKLNSFCVKNIISDFKLED